MNNKCIQREYSDPMVMCQEMNVVGLHLRHNDCEISSSKVRTPDQEIHVISGRKSEVITHYVFVLNKAKKAKGGIEDDNNPDQSSPSSRNSTFQSGKRV